MTSIIGWVKLVHSAIVNGEVLDYHYKAMTHIDRSYDFYVGDIFLGQVFKFRTGWKAVSMKVPCPYGVVGGFKTRYDASEFILQVCQIEDYYKNQ